MRDFQRPLGSEIGAVDFLAFFFFEKNQPPRSSRISPSALLLTKNRTEKARPKIPRLSLGASHF